MVVVLDHVSMNIAVSPLTHIVVADPRKRGVVVALQEALDGLKTIGLKDSFLACATFVYEDQLRTVFSTADPKVE